MNKASVDMIWIRSVLTGMGNIIDTLHNKYRITTILKVETDIIANISASPIGQVSNPDFISGTHERKIGR